MLLQCYLWLIYILVLYITKLPKSDTYFRQHHSSKVTRPFWKQSYLEITYNWILHILKKSNLESFQNFPTLHAHLFYVSWKINSWPKTLLCVGFSMLVKNYGVVAYSWVLWSIKDIVKIFVLISKYKWLHDL